MTPEQNKEYDDYCTMFASSGWITYTKQMSETREATLQAAPNGALTADQWHFARGMLNQMDSFLGFEAYVHAVFEQQKQAELETDDDVV